MTSSINGNAYDAIIGGGSEQADRPDDPTEESEETRHESKADEEVVDGTDQDGIQLEEITV